eukprot:m.38987 g.38987  ORF g.38987 m.38987 type:complete len:79 (-) comp11226_c0_seq1:976-1212(-)
MQTKKKKEKKSAKKTPTTINPLQQTPQTCMVLSVAQVNIESPTRARETKFPEAGTACMGAGGVLVVSHTRTMPSFEPE